MATAAPTRLDGVDPSRSFSQLRFTDLTFASAALENFVLPHIRRYVLNPWLNKKRGLIRGIQIDMSRVHFIGASEAAWLALAIESLRRSVGGQIGLILPENERANAFLNRWNFLEITPLDSAWVFVDDRSFNRYNAATNYEVAIGGSDKLVEFTTVPMRSTRELLSFQNVLGRIESVLQQQLNWNTAKVLISVFCNVFLLELLNNIREHSGAEYGLVAIQTHDRETALTGRLEWEQRFISENTSHVELFVGDAGVGIVRTLLPAFQKAGSPGGGGALLKFACQAGTTSKRNGDTHSESERGMGLFYVAKRVQEWRGAFEIRSGSGIICYAYLRDSGWTEFAQPLGSQLKVADFPGTQIKILLPRNVSTDALDRLSH